eukprot:augustus_masked-scaffold_2-processed-gene-16.47-mRNA-1 protein AED:0.00 eAED:0.00 QI:0/-1/0/1/-1/1/1/0/303
MGKRGRIELTKVKRKKAKATPNTHDIKKHEQYSLDKMRNFEPTLEEDLSDDEEVKLEEKFDEFSRMFQTCKYPKILLTTAKKPRKGMLPYIAEFLTFMPNLFYYERKQYNLLEISRWASKKGFTHLLVLSDRKAGVPNGLKKKHCLIEQLLVSCLSKDGEHGPTALFRVTNFKTHSELYKDGRRSGQMIGTQSDHIPEVILNGFGTRLGRRVGRLLSSLFGLEKEAEHEGRNIATFHCQRDFIFLRCHRYIFEKKKVRLQETGPRFTLKMKWLKKEGVDSLDHGKFEFVTKRALSKDKKQFFL